MILDSVFDINFRMELIIAIALWCSTVPIDFGQNKACRAEAQKCVADVRKATKADYDRSAKYRRCILLGALGGGCGQFPKGYERTTSEPSSDEYERCFK